jgi:hypothetical protein
LNKSKPIIFPKHLNLSFFEKKIYNSNLKNFLKSRDNQFINFYKKIKNYSMLSKERLYNLYDCINYVKNNKIKGDIVEVGCFKGANLSLCRKFSDKKIFGFDTFEGHPEPNINEIDIWGVNQNKLFNKKHKREGTMTRSWCKASVNLVKKNIKRFSNFNNVKLIKGKFEDQIKEIKKIKKIAILIIDVDWYEPTYFALKNFYSKIEKNGFLIIDDYGHHSGSKLATDFYFKNKRVKFHYIDYSFIVHQKI